MKLNEKKIEAVSALSGSERYSHFIKVAADQRKVWGLFSNGWALAQTGDGTPVFPLWPAPEYARRCALGVWADYDAREIDLDTLLTVLIPKLFESSTTLGIFPTAGEKGVTPEISEFESDIQNELARIE